MLTCLELNVNWNGFHEYYFVLCYSKVPNGVGEELRLEAMMILEYMLIPINAVVIMTIAQIIYLPVKQNMAFVTTHHLPGDNAE